MKRKICIVITTRGNYGKLKSVIREIRKNPSLELQVIVGGSAVLDKYGNLMATNIASQIKVNCVVHFVVEGENPVTMAKSAGMALSEFTTAFENLKPDVVVLVGDRFETLAIAMAASYMNIPVAHIEGGEVSGSIDESIRHAITKMSHLHFPATEGAAERIRNLGEDPKSIFTVGCTSLDVMGEFDATNMEPLIDLQYSAGVGPVVDLHQQYLVVIQHPVTTEYDHCLHHISQTITAINALTVNTIWIWPNMDAGSDAISKGIRIFREREKPGHIHFFKSLSIEYYAPILKNAACIVGNSSSGIREAAFFGTPSVTIGSRQNGRERGKNTIQADHDEGTIRQAILKQLDHGRYEPDFVYGDGKAGEKIARILDDHKFQVQKRIAY